MPAPGLISAARRRSAAGAFNPATLFASGETGDYWVFDRTHTNAASSGANMTSATGLVNGLAMSQSRTGVPTLDVVGGVDCCLTTGGDAGLLYTFASDISQPGTIVVALIVSGISVSQNFVGGSSSTKRWQVSKGTGNPTNVIMFAGSTVNSGVTYGSTTSRTWLAEFNGASTKFYENGSLTSGSINPGSQVTNRVCIGTNFDGSGGSTQRTFALLFINRILTSTEKTNVNTLFSPFTGLS